MSSLPLDPQSGLDWNMCGHCSRGKRTLQCLILALNVRLKVTLLSFTAIGQKRSWFHKLPRGVRNSSPTMLLQGELGLVDAEPSGHPTSVPPDSFYCSGCPVAASFPGHVAFSPLSTLKCNILQYAPICPLDFSRLHLLQFVLYTFL